MIVAVNAPTIAGAITGLIAVTTPIVLALLRARHDDRADDAAGELAPASAAKLLADAAAALVGPYAAEVAHLRGELDLANLDRDALRDELEDLRRHCEEVRRLIADATPTTPTPAPAPQE